MHEKGMSKDIIMISNISLNSTNDFELISSRSL